MKKILLSLLSSSIIACAGCGVLISCKSEPKIYTFFVKWRTEDLEWSVGNLLPVQSGTPREWVWIDHPRVNCRFEVADGYELPDGIQLSSDGHLSGTPTSPFMGDVRFKAISDGSDYAPNLSPAIKFIISQEGTEPTPISWTGDMSFQHNVSLVNNTMKVYKGEESTLEAGGQFALREGFNLPTGLLLANNGALSGTTPTTTGRTKVSFEYADQNPDPSFEKNVSPMFYIDICYRHNLEIKINPNSGQYLSNDLKLSMLSVDSNAIDNFDALTEWLLANKNWDTRPYPATGEMTNKYGDIWKIIGIALPAPHDLSKIKFYFDPTTNPGVQIEISKDDFTNITDTVK